MLDSLPIELCQHILQNLAAPDILACFQLNRSWASLGELRSSWKVLLLRDTDLSIVESIEQDCATATVSSFKERFLTHSYARMLSSVEWYPLGNNAAVTSPCAREGHLMCVLGNRLLVTGGFCDDPCVHILNLKPKNDARKRWMSVSCRSDAPYVYGASLTAIDNCRAIRFGGFRSGGYSNECNHVCLLTLDDDNGCTWETILTKGASRASPRAYHTATLIHNRYLLVVGGMQSTASIMNEAILDTKSWTWLDVQVSDPMAGPCPSGRHGHTAVLDQTRNRVVIFGGGNGTDLLRSGFDNTEVWELKLGSDSNTVFEESFPWDWRIIFRDACHRSGDGKSCPLTSVQGLTLGRCHIGAKVSRDSVVLSCGSGRPTSNGVLGYDLASDTFIFPQVSGSLPIPRFTAASTIIGVEGWLLIHGGYSLQFGTLGDTILLDLAPALKRSFNALPKSPDGTPVSHRPIREVDLYQLRNRTEHGALLRLLISAPVEQRQALARQILGRLAGSRTILQPLIEGLGNADTVSGGETQEHSSGGDNASSSGGTVANDHDEDDDEDEWHE